MGCGRRPARGFTLVELMLVIAIIGILSAIAIPAFSRYVKKSRTAEAMLQIEKLWSGAVSYYEADHADSNTTVQAKQFPAAGSITHQSPGACCSFPGGRCPGNHSLYSSPFSGFPHNELGFNLPSPHFYTPRPWGFPTARDFEITVWGDLDCDTTISTFKMNGTANVVHGNLGSGPSEPRRLGPPFVFRELE